MKSGLYQAGPTVVYADQISWDVREISSKQYRGTYGSYSNSTERGVFQVQIRAHEKLQKQYLIVHINESSPYSHKINNLPEFVKMDDYLNSYVLSFTSLGDNPKPAAKTAYIMREIDNLMIYNLIGNNFASFLKDQINGARACSQAIQK